MNATFVLVSSVAVAGLVVGWFTAAPIAAQANQNYDISVVRVQNGGALAARAGERFVALNLAPEPEVAFDAPPAPPPPPDIAVLFRRDLTAIEVTNSGVVAWVVDMRQPTLRRRIAPGEAYQDGWVVASISEQNIELRKRRETRQIAVYAPPVYDNP
ncbi:MAG: hypothetical protein AB7O98_07305 [Hyphomonadaceae bacterium]